MKKWCYLTDLRGDLQLDVLISNGCVWTQTINRLAFLNASLFIIFYEKRVNLELQVNVGT